MVLAWRFHPWRTGRGRRGAREVRRADAEPAVDDAPLPGGRRGPAGRRGGHGVQLSRRHVLLCVENAYFRKKENYITQEEWINLWQKAL
ncbi:protein rep, partial [Actinoplanes sp. NPDC051633]|uniref:protein rep n=1 Tax=Actinoplanes sp. NPDC051633 TaxID=3155670 RepID=UPI003419B7FE